MSQHQWFGERTWAQHGDDLILLNIFHHWLGITKPSYLDVGAHHPWELSNTALLYQRGSRGVNVEPNPDLFEAFLHERPHDCNLNFAVAPTSGTATLYRIDPTSGCNSLDPDWIRKLGRITSEVAVETKTINEIVANWCPYQQFPDLLTIDIEGLDLAVLESIDWTKSLPMVICVEVYPDPKPFYQLLQDHGYWPCFQAGWNAIFIKHSAVIHIPWLKGRKR